jgi:hypothetical protein
MLASQTQTSALKRKGSAFAPFAENEKSYLVKTPFGVEIFSGFDARQPDLIAQATITQRVFSAKYRKQ